MTQLWLPVVNLADASNTTTNTIPPLYPAGVNPNTAVRDDLDSTGLHLVYEYGNSAKQNRVSGTIDGSALPASAVITEWTWRFRYNHDYPDPPPQYTTLSILDTVEFWVTVTQELPATVDFAWAETAVKNAAAFTVQNLRAGLGIEVNRQNSIGDAEPILVSELGLLVTFSEDVTVPQLHPARQFPRSDGLGASSARRHFPVAQSWQGSPRRAGAYW